MSEKYDQLDCCAHFVPLLFSLWIEMPKSMQTSLSIFSLFPGSPSEMTLCFCSAFYLEVSRQNISSHQTVTHETPYTCANTKLNLVALWVTSKSVYFQHNSNSSKLKLYMYSYIPKLDPVHTKTPVLVITLDITRKHWLCTPRKCNVLLAQNDCKSVRLICKESLRLFAGNDEIGLDPAFLHAKTCEVMYML